MSIESRTLKPSVDQLDFLIEKRDGRYIAEGKSFHLDVSRFISHLIKDYAHLTAEDFNELGIWIQFKAEVDCIVHINYDRGVREIDGHTDDMTTEEITDENLTSLSFNLGLNNISMIAEDQEIDVDSLDKLEKKTFEFYISSLY